MIISMKRHASRAEIDEVTQRIEEFGYKIHTIEGEERVVIGAIGVGDTSAPNQFSASPLVNAAK